VSSYENAREELEFQLGGLEARDPSSEAAVLAHARSIVTDSRLDVALPSVRKIGEPAQTFTAAPELIELLRLVRRADVEQLKRALDRTEGGHGDKEHDPLFKGTNSVSPAPEAAHGTTLGEAISRMQSDPTRSQFGITADKKYILTFRAMKEVIGAGRAVASISRAECAEVQELIAATPANVSKLAAYRGCKDMRAVVALAAERGTETLMSPTTVRGYVHSMAAFFNWCIRKGLVTSNPATMLNPKKGHKGKSRRDYSIEELNKIMAGLDEWSENKTRPGRWWAPLIALYSGARMGEILTLQTHEVGVLKGVPCFILRETEDKRLKTEGAERAIPIHADLIKLGLLQHVAKQQHEGQSRLFPDLSGRDQRQIGDLFQKRFSYWQKNTLDIVGVSFHCFRHNFRDAMREGGLPIDAIRALGGWARGKGVEHRYGEGLRITSLAKWMDKVKFDGLVLPEPFTENT
jgi:integrase